MGIDGRKEICFYCWALLKITHIMSDYQFKILNETSRLLGMLNFQVLDNMGVALRYREEFGVKRREIVGRRLLVNYWPPRLPK